MTVTLSIDAVVLCFMLVLAVGGGLAIKWWNSKDK